MLLCCAPPAGPEQRRALQQRRFLAEGHGAGALEEVFHASVVFHDACQTFTVRQQQGVIAGRTYNAKTMSVPFA